jgi:lipoprotein-releasing system ATP-binding protein
MSEHIILTQDLYKTYSQDGHQVPVLKGINLKIRKGEIIAVVGPSGVGKSTLLHLLGALDRPTKGKVFLEKEEIYHLDDSGLAALRNRRIGFLFQFHHLLSDFTALENVMIPGLMRAQSQPEAVFRAREILAELGLGKRLNHRPSELSGGEQQRVALARALVNDPEIIITDEPTGNLDRATGEKIYELLWRLNEAKNKTLIIATHNEHLAARAERIIRLVDGQAVT